MFIKAFHPFVLVKWRTTKQMYVNLHIKTSKSDLNTDLSLLSVQTKADLLFPVLDPLPFF